MLSTEPSTLLHVAVAVIQDHRGRVLLSQRPEHVHQGGLWEFPGGKIESGETLSQALKRELREELNIEVTTHKPLIRITHHYSDKSVVLDVHRVTGFNGTPEGLEGQPLSWVSVAKIGDYPLPAADRPIVTALKLPPTYLITGADPTSPELFIQRLEKALQRGERLIQLRATDLAELEYRQLASTALERCREWGAQLLLNAEPEWADELGADGVHLNGRRLSSFQKRPLTKSLLVSASCHNSEELNKAEMLGLDFVVLSPVLPTSSHPDAKPLGWEKFRELVESCSLPVYALGGMSRDRATEAVANGGQGVAAIRGLWSEY